MIHGRPLTSPPKAPLQPQGAPCPPRPCGGHPIGAHHSRHILLARRSPAPAGPTPPSVAVSSAFPPANRRLPTEHFSTARRWPSASSPHHRRRVGRRLHVLSDRSTSSASAGPRYQGPQRQRFLGCRCALRARESVIEFQHQRVRRDGYSRRPEPVPLVAECAARDRSTIKVSLCCELVGC